MGRADSGRAGRSGPTGPRGRRGAKELPGTNPFLDRAPDDIRQGHPELLQSRRGQSSLFQGLYLRQVHSRADEVGSLFLGQPPRRGRC